MKTFHLSYQGYDDKGELVLSGSGGHSGVNLADVQYRLENNLKLRYPEVERININHHGYTEDETNG